MIQKSKVFLNHLFCYFPSVHLAIAFHYPTSLIGIVLFGIEHRYIVSVLHGTHYKFSLFPQISLLQLNYGNSLWGFSKSPSTATWLAGRIRQKACSVSLMHKHLLPCGGNIETDQTWLTTKLQGHYATITRETFFNKLVVDWRIASVTGYANSIKAKSRFRSLGIHFVWLLAMPTCGYLHIFLRHSNLRVCPNGKSHFILPSFLILWYGTGYPSSDVIGLIILHIIGQYSILVLFIH